MTSFTQIWVFGTFYNTGQYHCPLNINSTAYTNILLLRLRTCRMHKSKGLKNGYRWWFVEISKVLPTLSNCSSKSCFFLSSCTLALHFSVQHVSSMAFGCNHAIILKSFQIPRNLLSKTRSWRTLSTCIEYIHKSLSLSFLFRQMSRSLM